MSSQHLLTRKKKILKNENYKPITGVEPTKQKSQNLNLKPTSTQPPLRKILDFLEKLKTDCKKGKQKTSMLKPLEGSTHKTMIRPLLKYATPACSYAAGADSINYKLCKMQPSVLSVDTRK